MAALDLDFLRQVVNVHWGGGLAVEFTERPDYLTLNQSLSMSRVVISLWYRVPQDTVDKVRAAAKGSYWDFEVFNGVVPFITWGQQQTATVVDVSLVDTGAAYDTSHDIIYVQTTSSHTAPMPISCLGVSVGWKGDAGGGAPVLHVHIQTNANPSGTGLVTIPTSWIGDFTRINDTPGHVPDTLGRPMYANVEFTNTDISQTYTGYPDYFGNSGSHGSPIGNPSAGKPDEWHHLLITWDLVSGTSKMWCAIDDKNKNGDELPAMSGPPLGPNDHMAWVPWSFAGNPDVSVSPGGTTVPTDPIQLPAVPSTTRASNGSGGMESVHPIEMVELAELQIFSGVTLDTSVESNRRAFIDFIRDENGNPIMDEDGKRTLKPVNPERAEELLGKKPEVLLHGASNWKQGKNTGSIGIDVEGTEIPSGQFKPAGEIAKYSPDPSIVEA